MKAVILAAGEGKRLKPFTEDRPKVMLPLANKPILEHILEALIKNGINDIILVVGFKKESILDYFGNGQKFGVKIEYVTQERQVGTGHALLQAESYMDSDFLVLPGDNIIDKASVAAIMQIKGYNALLIENSHTPSKYGVVHTKNDTITDIIEKPVTSELNQVSTGIYRFNLSIFDFLKKAMKVGKNDITDAVQLILKNGKQIYFKKGKGGWMDVIYPWDILDVNAKILQETSQVTSGTIEKNVTIKGVVNIGKGTIIHSGSYLLGPVVIGNDCEIGPHSCIFPSSSIGNNVAVYPFTEIRQSVLMDGCTIGSHSLISYSVIGKDASIFPHVTTLLGKSVMKIDDRYIEKENIGCFIGGFSQIGSHVVIDPGTLIGRSCEIAPLRVIQRNLASGSKVM